MITFPSIFPALLDGNEVPGGTISAKTHRYIGMFRKPYAHPVGVVICICGEALHTYRDCHEHWLRGHWDAPQYETIKHDPVSNPG